MGFEIDEDLFAYLEHYARRKLEVANKSAGRAWGEDGYGDEYLSLLIPDVIREMAFSAYCDQRSAENLAARKALGNGWTVDVIAHILSAIPKEGDSE